MRLTTRTNLAIRALMYCAVHDGQLSRSAEIAHACNSSANHLAQVVHHLNAHGFVHATRGRMGGVKLARPARAINIGEVFRIFEADVPFTECFSLDNNTCPLVRACRLRNAIRRALDAFYREMDLVTLEDLVKGNYLLDEIFAVTDTAAVIGCAGPARAARG
ncbi:RrF2 family transcriptional regulator [Sinisalibacter aestuarii]|uniref:Rrf2 family transcriptional regulator n=1 Tax=Sinisalibacter aestuarii TaxID=2949426 RepID=A0ABQ5LX22_9RHOB|nr:Rrf2 family transcriptional regulator [Sinisalibacter aestuarii]GKY89540.1 Rrf2 family transcriptional regulator [Sinisalibacter aestuarii]